MAVTLAITMYLSGLVSSAAIPKRTRYNDLRRRVTADSQQREWHGSLYPQMRSRPCSRPPALGKNCLPVCLSLIQAMELLSQPRRAKCLSS
jgi:hypothetical protein